MTATAGSGGRLFWLLALAALSAGVLAACQPRAKAATADAPGNAHGPHPDGDAEAYADPEMAGDDAEAAFLREALRSGMAEQSLAEFAREHAQSGAVRSLATALARDHAALNQRLRAQFDGATGDPAPSARQRSEDARLRALDGRAFEVAWLTHLARTHARSIARFQAVAAGAAAAGTKALAAEALPTLRSHRDRIALLRQGVAAPSPMAVQP